MHVLILGKTEHRDSRAVSTCCERSSTRTLTCLGRVGDPFPEAAAHWSGDLIISYLSPWIVPASILARAGRAAINFHPAPPEYPGIGCVNFALYEEAAVYGVTCHHMAPAVDSGEIIAVRRFPIRRGDDVASLLERTYQCQLALFYEVMAGLRAGRPLPRSTEQWGAHLYTRRELNELARLDPAMTVEDMRRRVRATTYGQWRPEVRIHGLRFVYSADVEPGPER